MKIYFKFAAFVIVLSFVSCHEQKVTELEKTILYDNFGKVSNVFFTNRQKQKDSIEDIYFFGQLTKKIFWKEGSIDSIANYDNSFDKFSGYDVIKDSLIYTYDKENQMIQKSSINANGRYEGIAIHYEDSLITGVSNFVNGQKEGLVVRLNRYEYPSLIGILQDNTFPFSISLNESGLIKSLRINYEQDKFGISYRYHSNGQLKSKTELRNGKANGIQYQYDEEGNLIATHRYSQGVLIMK